MKKLSSDPIDLHEVLTGFLGEVNAKHLFSGIGIYHKDNMFGICKQGGFYLRAKGKLAEQIQKIGARRWEYVEHDSNLKIRDYYLMPSVYLLDEDKREIFSNMLKESLAQIEQEKMANALESAKRIRKLPSLSLKAERLLGKVGIESITQLREIGAADAYIMIKEKGLFVTSQMYWRIYAALKNKYMEMLTEDEKDKGLKEINEKLAAAKFLSMKYRP